MAALPRTEPSGSERQSKRPSPADSRGVPRRAIRYSAQMASLRTPLSTSKRTAARCPSAGERSTPVFSELDQRVCDALPEVWMLLGQSFAQQGDDRWRRGRAIRTGEFFVDARPYMYVGLPEHPAQAIRREEVRGGKQVRTVF